MILEARVNSIRKKKEESTNKRMTLGEKDSDLNDAVCTLFSFLM